MIVGIIIIAVATIAIGILAFVLHKREKTSQEEVVNKPVSQPSNPTVDEEPEKPKEEESKPKFKVGDWITNGDYTWKIVEVEPLGYILQSQNGNIVDDTISHIDKQFHSFTIEDAKAGDVLFCKSSDIEYIVMNKGVNEHGNIDSYFRYNSLDGFGVDIPAVLSTRHDDITPATKEQRDQLEKAITKAGYKWNKEDLKLEKI